MFLEIQSVMMKKKSPCITSMILTFNGMRNRPRVGRNEQKKYIYIYYIAGHVESSSFPGKGGSAPDKLTVNK